MEIFGRLMSGIREYYSEINSATLTGAIDIIVVRQADGSFVGSPFHVRFGKIGVLRSREKVVDISINDEPANLQMKLGDAGEAFFVTPCEEEDVPHYLCTSPIPDAESLMREGIAKMKEEIKKSENHSFGSDTQDNNKKKSCSHALKTSHVDSDNDSDNEKAMFVKRSMTISVPKKRNDSDLSHCTLKEYYPLSDLDSPLDTPKHGSPTNTQLSSPLKYLSDTEVSYGNDGDNHVTWNWGSLPQGLEEASSSSESRSLSDLKKEANKAKGKSQIKAHHNIGEGMYLDDLLSVETEVANLYLQQTSPHEEGTRAKASNKENRNGFRTSKSDTHLHRLGEEIASKRTVKILKDGLESIKSESDLESSYKKTSDAVAGADEGAGRNDIDGVKSDSELNKSDGDSGLGSSVSVSPDENKTEESELYQNIAISLCGDIRRGKVSSERFMESAVSFDEFAKSATQILSNPKLLVRINDRYYNSSVAVPMLMSFMIYQRPLPKNSVDALIKDHMPKKTKRRGYSSWLPWRSPPEHTESTDEEGLETERKQYRNEGADETDANLREHGSSELLQDIPESGGEAELPVTASERSTETYKKVLELSSEQLASLNLKDGANEVTFSVTTKYQGTASCSASIFLFNYNDKIIISDIDGTITKSDVLGHILPASFWAQSGVAKLFSSIQKNGYKFMYLSARPIGQAELTRHHLRSVVQENLGLPNGPLFLSPSSLIKAFHREIIEKKPEDFKIPCLRNIQKLFPTKHEPFFAGFGNRMNDVVSYRAVGIPVQRIFTVNHKGELRHEFTNAFQSSYTEMQDLVDQMFPPLHCCSGLVLSDDYSTFTYWRTPLTSVQDDEPVTETPLALVAKA